MSITKPFKRAGTFIRDVIGSRYAGLNYTVHEISVGDSEYQDNTVIVNATLRCTRSMNSGYAYYQHIMIMFDKNFFNAYKDIGFNKEDYHVKKLDDKVFKIREKDYLEKL